jgi:aminoglycoside phosphotransferase (APT) family kinase protein
MSLSGLQCILTLLLPVDAPNLVIVKSGNHGLHPITNNWQKLYLVSPSATLQLQEAKTALNWLAAFHAVWWEELPYAASSSKTGATAGQESPAAAALAEVDLWDQGCYWHLETRQDELAQMGSSWNDLKEAAPRIDHAIRGIFGGSSSSRYTTLVHGDFKSENVLFNSDCSECAAYDFQYCGAGYGVRDVAYLLCSSVDAQVVEQQEQQLLDHYHMQLQQQLKQAGKTAAAEQYSREVMAVHYELCLLDYVRFMAGWGMWGNTRWATVKAKAAMKQLPELLKKAESFLL